LSLVRAVVESWLKMRQQVQQPQPSQTFRQPQATRKPGIETYDFEDSGQLRELITEIQKGQLPQPKPVLEVEPDFGSYGPSETARRLKERMGLKAPAGVGGISQPVVSKRSAVPDSLIADIPVPEQTYEKPEYDFGYNSGGPTQSLVASRPILTPEQLPPPPISKRSSYVEDWEPRESFEEFMHGSAPKPPLQPTLKDIGKAEMRKERYWFIAE